MNTVQVYDSASNTWQLGAPLLLGVNHPMPAVANGKVYVIGGQTDTGSAFVNNVQEFDPAATNWTSRAAHAHGAQCGRSGGHRRCVSTSAADAPPQGQDFAVYPDTRSNLWQTLPNLPTGRNHLAAGAIGGKVDPVAGGRLGAGFTSAMTNVLEVFDPADRHMGGPRADAGCPWRDQWHRRKRQLLRLGRRRAEWGVQQHGNVRAGAESLV